MTKPGEKFKLTLTKPVQAHGQAVSFLEFRAPSGEDLMEIGTPPFTVDGKGNVHFDFAATGEYIVRLADVPLSTVKQLSPADMMQAVGVVSGFFGDLGTIRKRSSRDTSS